MNLSQLKATAGAGDPLLTKLKRFGIADWREVLLCAPKDFFDYSKVSTLKQAIDQGCLVSSEKQIFSLIVTQTAATISQPKQRICLSATDGRLTTKIVIFVSPGVQVDYWNKLQLGQRINIKGCLQNWGGNLQIVSPNLVPEELIGKVSPVYDRKRSVLAEGALFDASRHALSHHLEATSAYLIDSFKPLSEQSLLRKARLSTSTVSSILVAAHAPTSMEEGLRGLASLKRLAALSIVENAKRMRQRQPSPASVIDLPKSQIDSLCHQIPFPLTNDQRQAIEEIRHDLALPYPMRRILIGDVGCGKTACIMVPSVAMQQNDKQVIVLSPNTLLAEQFVNEAATFFPNTPVIAVTATTRKLDLTNNPILVGTTALLNRLANDDVTPSLVIVDEQQKFSVAQKEQLLAITSNYIEVTATPIPRTTALISHAAMDVSIIKESPVHKKITSYLVFADQATRMYEHTKRVLETNGQVAVVYPIVEADPEQEKKSVISAYDDWNSRFPNRVAMVHGQMKDSEKLRAVQSLKTGEKQIGVVSSVIECGLTLPSLRSMVVINAERYGTSTLHQLRGRLARHGGTGYFFLYVPDPIKDDTRRRLELLLAHSDGFTLSEKDAELRGYGDLFESAERQSGTSRSTVIRCVDLTPADIHQIIQLSQEQPNDH